MKILCLQTYFLCNLIPNVELEPNRFRFQEELWRTVATDRLNLGQRCPNIATPIQLIHRHLKPIFCNHGFYEKRTGLVGVRRFPNRRPGMDSINV